ncbi:MAG: alpha/beta fold hydrolase [Saprospiraceae bacterium]
MKLNYKEFGQGDPVIILHGLFGTSDNWQTIAKKIAENYSVYIIDQRNHGRSPHDDEFNYKVMAEDLKNFMESHWIYSARIIGHSMGGKTAMQFATDYPDMVEKLVVVDIANESYEGGHEVIFNALLGLDLEKVESRKEADALLQTQIEDFGVRQFLLKNLTRSKDGKYIWKMNLPIIHQNYQAILSKIEGDEVFEGATLFVKGGLSKYVTEANFETTKHFFPNAKLETIENVGHWVHAEAPKELLEILEKFLE